MLGLTSAATGSPWRDDVHRPELHPQISANYQELHIPDSCERFVSRNVSQVPTHSLFIAVIITPELGAFLRKHSTSSERPVCMRAVLHKPRRRMWRERKGIDQSNSFSSALLGYDSLELISYSG